MDWLDYLALLAQIVLALPVILVVAYTTGWWFTAGATSALLAKAKRFIAANQKDEKDIL